MPVARRIAVPVTVQRRIPVPPRLSELIEHKLKVDGKTMPIVTDFDDTLCPTPLPEEFRIAFNLSPVQLPVLRLIRKQVPFVIITGSRRDEINRRFISPLKEILADHGEMSLMKQVIVYSNGGANRCVFDEAGNLDIEGMKAYASQFEISQPDEKLLTDVMREAAGNYWKRYRAAERSMRRRYADFVFRQPVVQRQGRAKLTLSPLPTGERAPAMRFIRKKLRQAQQGDLLTRCPISPGGRSTINAFDARINKAFALRDLLSLLGIAESPDYPVIYFGDAFFSLNAPGGENYLGSDTPVLGIANVLPIAVNNNQAEIASIRAKELIRGGSGPEAVLRWLTYINDQLEGNA